MAAEALGAHIRFMQRDNDPIPAPSAVADVVADPENVGAIVFFVTPAPPKGRAIRANITVEEGLLTEIDAYAESHSMTRSAFLANAAREAMATG